MFVQVLFQFHGDLKAPIMCEWYISQQVRFVPLVTGLKHTSKQRQDITLKMLTYNIFSKTMNFDIKYHNTGV